MFPEPQDRAEGEPWPEDWPRWSKHRQEPTVVALADGQVQRRYVVLPQPEKS